MMYSVGPSNGHDDTDMLQDAIRRAAETRGFVYLPGNYRLRSPLRIGYSGVTLSGDGMGISSLTFDYEASGPYVIIGGGALVDRISIEHLTLQHNVGTSGPTVLIDRASYVELDHVEVKNAHDSIQIASPMYPFQAGSIRVLDCELNYSRNAIYARGGNTLWVRGTRGNGVAGRNGSFFYLDGPAGFETLIMSDVLSEHTDNGIAVRHHAQSAAHWAISNSVFDGIQNVGCWITPTGTGTVQLMQFNNCRWSNDNAVVKPSFGTIVEQGLNARVGGVMYTACQFWHLNRPAVVIKPAVKGVLVKDCQDIRPAGTTILNMST